MLNGGYCLEYLAGCSIHIALFPVVLFHATLFPVMLFHATFPLSDSVFSKLLTFWFMRASLFLNSVGARKALSGQVL